jgi:outer membrane protein assembly factor BamB
MADLTRTQRLRLLDILQRVRLFDTQQGRDLLLGGLPNPLRTSITRSDNEAIDLNKIVDAVQAWRPQSNDTDPLLVLLENARLYAGAESEAGQAFTALAQELTGSGTLASLTAYTLSPIERAERYRELKVAAAALQWQRMQELSVGIEHYKDVPDLLARYYRLLEEIAQAYEADDWAQVIRLARQLGPEAPPEVAGWVAHAWREVPVEQKVLGGHINSVFAVAVTPNGKQILSGSGDQTVRRWDLATGEEFWPFTGNLRPILSVAITPDGQQALAGCGDGKVVLWDWKTGKQLWVLTRNPYIIWAVAVTPNGRQALSGSGDGTLWLWDLATGQELRIFTGHESAVRSVVVTPEGQHALSGSEDKTLRLWDLATGQELRIFTGHESAVRSVAVTPDGQHALSGSEDGTLRLWDLATGQELRSLTRLLLGMCAVVVSPDGRTVVSGGYDGTVRVWTLPKGLLG